MQSTRKLDAVEPGTRHLHLLVIIKSRPLEAEREKITVAYHLQDSEDTVGKIFLLELFPEFRSRGLENLL